ncbi:MAG: bifunctional metallophosphatase/5'-nucleotidase [Bacteriovoracaceae bacterium]|jgi:5'-nucleotidase / UDP-sugar diphosphatase|nr:bifunctional metallophosphatase/5'-nucleotidase [Bacteriovoracaceae bacterium]
MRFLAICFLLVSSYSLHAITLDLYHTNDLHSYMEDSGDEPSLGGYPALKASLDDNKKKSLDAGNETLLLDGGDFSEGNLYYWAEKGFRSFEAVYKLGYDAVVVGNHDWLMGSPELNAILKRLNPKKPFLSANMSISVAYPYIGKHIRPYQIFNKGGVKIGVIGLTTKEILYQWQLVGGKIKNPIKAAKKYVKILRKQHDVDFVIMLTHLGSETDKEMIRKVEGIDLVVGGHSHEFFPKPIIEKNSKSGQLVPIVQLGAHGKWLGKMTLDLVPDKPLKIEEYEVLEVKNSVEDSAMLSYVENAKKEYRAVLGETWLDEVVGYSEVPLEPAITRPTIWGNVVTDAIKEVIDADVSVHSGSFEGHEQPAGNITRANIVTGYPRIFELKDPTGWKIYDVYIQGWLVGSVSWAVLKLGIPLYFGGLDFDLEDKGKGKLKVKNMRIDGKKINPLKFYRVALTEGVVRGGFGISSLVGLIFRSVWKSGYTVFEAIEKKIESLGGTISKDYGLERGYAHGIMLVPIKGHKKRKRKFNVFKRSGR